MTGIAVARRLGNGRLDPVPSRGKATTVSLTPLTSAFAGDVGPINLRKVHDRANNQNCAPNDRTASMSYEKRTKSGGQQLRREKARERAGSPGGAETDLQVVGEMPAAIGLVRDQSAPWRPMSRAALAEDWNLGSNVLRFHQVPPQLPWSRAPD